jgi:hypothetical protein
LGINRKLGYYKPGVQFTFQVLDNRLDRGVISDFDLAGVLVTWPAYMSHEDEAASSFHDIVQGAQGCIDAVRVTYFPLLDHVVVNSNKDDLFLEIGLLDERQIEVYIQFCHDMIRDL